MRLNESGITSVAIENTEKIVILGWKIIDVDTGVLHKESPSLVINQIPFM